MRASHILPFIRQNCDVAFQEKSFLYFLNLKFPLPILWLATFNIFTSSHPHKEKETVPLMAAATCMDAWKRTSDGSLALRRDDWEGVMQLKCMFIDQFWLSAPLEKASHYPIDEVIISLLPSTSLQSSKTPCRLYTDIPSFFQRLLLMFISSAVPLSELLTACH